MAMMYAYLAKNKSVSVVKHPWKENAFEFWITPAVLPCADLGDSPESNKLLCEELRKALQSGGGVGQKSVSDRNKKILGTLYGTSSSGWKVQLEGSFLHKLKCIFCDDLEIDAQFRNPILTSTTGKIELPSPRYDGSRPGNYANSDEAPIKSRRVPTLTSSHQGFTGESLQGLHDYSYGWEDFWAQIQSNDCIRLQNGTVSMLVTITIATSNAPKWMNVGLKRKWDNEDDDSTLSDPLLSNKRMLRDEIGTDIVIVAKNGEEVACHKLFLIANSPVLAALFQGDYEEAKANRIEMPEMTEAGVRAFLDYLYWGDVKEALKSAEIASMLLQAAHKYHVSNMERKISVILMEMPNMNISVVEALNLFLFARNVMSFYGIRDKCIQVLKLRFEEFEQLPEYDDLFKDPKLAKEVMACAFTS